MAQLKINSDIVSEDSRQFMMLFWGVDGGVSYDSVESFLESIPADDGKIDISIHCNGGEVMEGWSIYDKLRASGKELSATIEGKCASMASILLLAAPKERRYGRPNASLLIHEPYLPFVDGKLTAGELERLSVEMAKETDRIVNVYVERTGADENVIRALMKEDRYISMDKAIELGFISKTIAPVTAKATNSFNQSNMGKDEVKVSKSFMDKVLAKLGYSKIEDAEKAMTPVALELTTEAGTPLTVERESGDPQVGDKASPDGTHTMPDGKTIVVVDGVITEITEGEPVDEEKEALKARIAELEGLLKTANDTNEASQAKAKTAAEIDILNKVSALGGIEKLRTIASTYVPSARGQQTNKLDKNDSGEEKDPLQEKVNEIKEKHKNKGGK